MGERTRTKAHASPSHDHAAATMRAAERDDPERASSTGNPMLDLQALAGNQAVAQMVAQRQPTDEPVNLVTVQTPAEAAADLVAAEDWVRFVALRANVTAPERPLPSRYRSQLAIIQAAVGGPGPIPAADVAATATALGGALGTVARSVVARMQADRRSLLPKASTDAYDSVDLALELGEGNRTAGGAEATTARDQGIVLLSIQSSAEDEIRAAKADGYDIPRDLANVPSEAAAMLTAAREGWKGGGATDQQYLTPANELDLDLFSEHASAAINSVRGRRVADIARARQAEADALWKAGNEQMAALKVMLADKRSEAFRTGKTDVLDQVSEALGSVAGAIEDTRAAASIITDRVDQLNAAVSMVSASGKGIISLPEVPGALSNVADKLVSANEKIKLVIDLLDLAAPAKTKLDEGLKYLKGVDMALEHFASKSANPFVTVYVGTYLSPGIERCMESIGVIAGIISADNKRNIEGGMPAMVEWQVEFGGEAIYLFLASVYRMGGAATLSDEAWSFLRTHRGDLSAAVGAELPGEQRLVPAWASAHRQALWEAFYGSTRPPR